MANKQLSRSSSDKIIGGVCAGVANRLDIDVSIVRIIWVCATLFAGIGPIIYLVLWILLPES